MSSVKFEGGKSKGGQQASAYLRHNDPTPENRARVKKAKENAGELCFIDVEKSKRNYSFLITENEAENGTEITVKTAGDNYGAAWGRYKARIDEIDASALNTNKRKDRVTMLSLEIPVPDALSGEENAERRKQWFKGVALIIAKKYGAKNIVQCAIHEDEVHAYIDAETHEERVSREHMHISIIPERDGQLNCKWASKRSNIVQVNKAVDDYTRAEFGEEFHTGARKRSAATVNELKAESARLEAEAEAKRRQAAAERAELDTAIKTQQAELDRLRRDKQREEDELETLKALGEKYALQIDIDAVTADKEAIQACKETMQTELKAIQAERERLAGTESELNGFLAFMDGTQAGAWLRERAKAYKDGEQHTKHENTPSQQREGRISLNETIETYTRIKDAHDKAEAAAYMPTKISEIHSSVPSLYTERDEADKQTLDERAAERKKKMQDLLAGMKPGAGRPEENAPEY